MGRWGRIERRRGNKIRGLGTVRFTRHAQARWVERTGQPVELLASAFAEAVFLGEWDAWLAYQGGRWVFLVRLGHGRTSATCVSVWPLYWWQIRLRRVRRRQEAAHDRAQQKSWDQPRMPP